MQSTAINNSIIRSTCKPALKALQAILSILSNGYIKISISSLKQYLKEGRTAINSRLSELKEIQDDLKEPAKGFTLIPETVLLSPTLSLTSKGLYMMIRSYATFAGFVITKDYFYKKSGMYYKTFDRAWKELQTAGFLATHQHRSPSGKFIYTYEMPELENVSQSEVCSSVEQKEAKQDKPKTVIELTAEIARLHRVIAKATTKKREQNVKSELPLATDQRRKNNFAPFPMLQNSEPEQVRNFKQRIYSDEFLNSFIITETEILNCCNA